MEDIFRTRSMSLCTANRPWFDYSFANCETPLKFSEACFMALPDLETLQVKRLRGVMRTCEYSLRWLLLIQNMMTFTCFKVNKFFVDFYDVIGRNIVLKSAAVPYLRTVDIYPSCQGSCFFFSSAIKPCNSNMPILTCRTRLLFQGYNNGSMGAVSNEPVGPVTLVDSAKANAMAKNLFVLVALPKAWTTAPIQTPNMPSIAKPSNWPRERLRDTRNYFEIFLKSLKGLQRVVLRGL